LCGEDVSGLEIASISQLLGFGAKLHTVDKNRITSTSQSSSEAIGGSKLTEETTNSNKIILLVSSIIHPLLGLKINPFLGS
jgi:hypothetical protein